MRRLPVLLAVAATLLGCAIALAAAPGPHLALRLSSARIHAGRVLRVRLADRRGAGGFGVTLCLVPPAGARRCRSGSLAGRRPVRTVPVHAPRPGRWVVRAYTRHGSVARRLRVLPRTGRLDLVATGDSMIQYVDVALRRALPRTRVTSDAHVGTGLSKAFQFNWLRHAHGQAHAHRQDLTVMFIGPNEGFPFGRVACCSHAWSVIYGQRVRAMMRAYARGGAAGVYWLLLPAARDARFARVFRAVDAGIELAARHAPPGAEVVDLRRVISPHGFQAIRGGVRIRQGDGVHLTPAGARIAAAAVVRRLRRDGVPLGPRPRRRPAPGHHARTAVAEEERLRGRDVPHPAQMKRA